MLMKTYSQALSVFSLASYIILRITGAGFRGDEPGVFMSLFLVEQSL